MTADKLTPAPPRFVPVGWQQQGQQQPSPLGSTTPRSPLPEATQKAGAVSFSPENSAFSTRKFKRESFTRSSKAVCFKERQWLEYITYRVHYVCCVLYLSTNLRYLSIPILCKSYFYATTSHQTNIVLFTLLHLSDFSYKFPFTLQFFLPFLSSKNHVSKDTGTGSSNPVSTVHTFFLWFWFWFIF